MESNNTNTAETEAGSFEERSDHKQRPSFMEKDSGFSNIAKDRDNDKIQMDAFFGSDRNYIILTNSGKPVFSSKGDIYTLSSVYATLFAIVSKV